ncbi:MAG TPA: DUF4865 family protein [Candidatus Dormibacteraeota bacterium]
MIAATIHFTLPEDTDWDAVRDLMRERAQLYVGLRGLHSKAFVIDPATRTYGGNYVFDSREALDDFLASDIFTGARTRFGEPRVSVYEVVANLEGDRVMATTAR